MLLLATVCINSVSAEVYRSVDRNGNVTYTNKAVKGAEKIKLKPLSVYSAPEFKSANKGPEEPSGFPGYKSVVITAPAEDATLRDNPGNVTVTAGSEPALDLREGHKFQFFLDDKSVGEPQESSTKMLANLDRGEHQVGVAIVDVNGKSLKRSKKTRFFLHRQTLHSPARRPPPPPRRSPN